MRGPILVMLAACCWGGWSLALKPAEAASPGGLPAAFEGFVILLATALMVGPLLWREQVRGTAPALDARSWRTLAALGISDALNALCFFVAMQQTTVAIAVVTHYLAPIFVALLAPVVVRERLTGRTMGALVVALVGLWMLLRPWEADASRLQGGLWGALSAVFFAANVFLAKSIGPRASVGQLAFLPKMFTVPVLALFVPWATLDVSAQSIAILVGGTAVFGAIPLVMFYRGFAKTPASQTSVLTMCEPLTAVLVGTLVWQEPLGALGVMGGALVLGGALSILRASSPPSELEIPSVAQGAAHTTAASP